ncbi:YkgJ family cysteine cluster protein [Betaproteobacteria bacterium LSUCC0115]|nr:YkgJ family cysteine cluster protein [Burkholderiales bacterium LSUCC0115]
MSKNKVDYDCSKCPGYCCSYPRIVVTDRDIKRLAKHFGLSEEKAKTRFTRSYVFKSDKPKETIKERILKHRKDQIYATICQFFDQDLRRCTVYEARPDVCRQFPDGKKCGYYTFLKFERKHQGDQDFIPSA